ncbi:Aminotran_1_2 domain-containing protein [Cephalotus follicularis]|uniref:Aminotran_1_2 domain-containing protein n=1 Tax=Cephalotus follicularis TaxID=3775 RepID=A0A1Q3ARP8_CEPFO|nr:Aminotran_1_2 domain-containing protein [Cephalotus follicularis]
MRETIHLQRLSLLLGSMTVATNVSRFEGVMMAYPHPILGVSEAFKAHTHEMKLNLGVGAHQRKELQPYVLKVVQKAENLMLERGKNKVYLSIEGLVAFNKVTAEFFWEQTTQLYRN